MSSYRMKYKIGATQYNIPVVDDISGFGSGIPLGTILPYPANSEYPPEGFLFCDGSAISRTMYADLFSLIGTIYGPGDGSTTFNLPDLTGKFIEGAATAGTEHEAGLPDITGKANHVYAGSNNYGSGAFSDSIEYTVGASMGGSSTSSYKWKDIDFKASNSNSIYGNSTTVQPESLTMRYIIKAFSATTAESQLIDVTQYASALNQKLTDNDIYGNNFTIIYPNNTTEENPYVISKASRVVISNPFPGYLVYCLMEFKFNGSWGPAFANYYYSGGGYGNSAFQYDNDSIVLWTGSSAILDGNANSGGHGFGNISGGSQTSGPCRVKVWKIGKLPSQS